MSATMETYGETVVVRVDHPVHRHLALTIAAYMHASDQTLTVGNLRKHARDAYAHHGTAVDVDPEGWADEHFPTPAQERDWTTARNWLTNLENPRDQTP
jgi:hypothetical protein